MKKQETPEERAARQGGANEVAGSDSARRAQQKMQQMDRQKQRQQKRRPGR